MKTNLNSDKHVRHPCGANYNQEQGYATCPLVLFVFRCAGDSPIGIPLALSVMLVLGWCLGGVGHGGVLVVGLRAGFKVTL